MVKHPAWAAAINSSGFVPFSFSKRVRKEYGVSASTPESVERLPLPSRPVPRQTAFALRIMVRLLAIACSELSQAHYDSGRSRRLFQGVGVDRHLSQALARRCKDRVGDRGDDRRGPSFAHPARRLGTLDDMDLDRRRLADAQHLIGVEVGLLDPAIFQRDLAIERGGDAENDRALDL